MNPQDIITENQRRKTLNDKPYNPYTGENCYGDRIKIDLPDCPQGIVWLPAGMMEDPGMAELLQCRSLQERIDQIKQQHANDNSDYTGPVTVEELWLSVCVTRTRYDFEYFACSCERIRHKITGQEIPFILNAGQRKTLALLETFRTSGTPARAVILKSRQWGCSTFIQMYILWIQARLKKNWNSVICAHYESASRKINDMFVSCLKNMPRIFNETLTIRPFARSGDTLYIPERGNRITIGTAQNPESVRSDDVKIAHFSEIPYYPQTEKNNPTKLVAAIVSSIPYVENSMIIYESTANGVGGFFYNLCIDSERGASANRFLFIPWHETGELASIPLDGNSFISHAGLQTPGTLRDFVHSMNRYERNLFKRYPAITLENIQFYRSKKAELGDLIFREYPSDSKEAFKTNGTNVFNEDHINEFYPGCETLPVDCGIIQGDANASEAIVNAKNYKRIMKNIRFITDDDALAVAQTPRSAIGEAERERRLNNKLIIWQHPDSTQSVANRYLVVYDPARGQSDKADWGDIVVLDRYWRMSGGITEVVAEWRGHEDLYIAVWIAAQIAAYYNNALLVIECNTFDSMTGRAVAIEYIFETIKDHYPNLYSHTDPQKIREGRPARYGFFTGRNKANLVQHYKAVLAEHGYIERSQNTLDQARVYECLNGKYGAKQGYHDDDLMTRMIGLYIDHNEMPLPILRNTTTPGERNRPLSDTEM